MTVGQDPIGAAPIGSGADSDLATPVPSQGDAYIADGFGSSAYIAEITDSMPRGLLRMNNNRTDLSAPAMQAGDYLITGQLRDENDGDIELTAIGTATLTLYDAESEEIINSVEESSILDTVNGQITSDGEVRIFIRPTDNILLDDDRKNEEHVALVKFTYQGGAKQSSHEFHFFVRRVPNL